MRNLVESVLKRSIYGVASAAKTGWYSAQYVATRHLAGPFTPPGEVPRPLRSARLTDKSARDAFLALLAKEAADISAGIYRLPKEFRSISSPLRVIDLARRNLIEAKAVARRRYRNAGATEIRDTVDGVYPAYYLQNFHYQSGGWLTDESASMYDTQVEAIFTGAGSAMRRRVLPFLTKELRSSAENGVSQPTLLDVASGTGRVLVDVVDNYPNLTINALDLSLAYLHRARMVLNGSAKITYTQGQAENMPFADGTNDIVMSVYLFHELPPKVRPVVAAEIARVTKPGGLYLHTDTVQYEDTPMDILLESFPRAVHEPYYESYAREDLDALFCAHGFYPEGQDIGFLTKVRAYRKKAA